MLSTNHTLTGIALSQVIDNPLLLAPAATASHLALDSLPHFGMSRFKNQSRDFVILATIDNLIAIAIVLAFIGIQPQRTVQILVGSFFAVLPDVLFIPEIIRGRMFQAAWRRFHSKIQWSETPYGAITEILWAASIGFLLFRLVQ